MLWCVPLWVQLLWDSLSFLNFLEVYFFARLGNFSFMICSNKFSIFCSCSSPSGTPMIWMLECLKMSWRFLSLLMFLNCCFFLLFWLNVYFFLLLQIVDLSPSLLSSLLVPCAFSFISLCIAFIFSSNL